MTKFTGVAVLLCYAPILVNVNGVSPGWKMMRGAAQDTVDSEVGVHRMTKVHGKFHKLMPECGGGLEYGDPGERGGPERGGPERGGPERPGRGGPGRGGSERGGSHRGSRRGGSHRGSHRGGSHRGGHHRGGSQRGGRGSQRNGPGGPRRGNPYRSLREGYRADHPHRMPPVDMECVDKTRDDFFVRIGDNNKWLREDITDSGSNFAMEIDEINDWVEEEMEKAHENCGGSNNGCYRQRKAAVELEAEEEYRWARMERKANVRGTYDDYGEAKRDALQQLREELDLCCITDMSFSFSFSFAQSMLA